MAETLEKQICQACGVDIRPKALFCFNCGSQVASDEDVEIENQHQKKISNAWFKEEITENKVVEKTPVATKKKKSEPVGEKPAGFQPKVIGKTGAEKKSLEKPDSLSELRTAASMRNKSKLETKKAVEVVWDEPKSAPNIWFLLVTLILAGFAVFVLFAMLTLR